MHVLAAGSQFLELCLLKKRSSALDKWKSSKEEFCCTVDTISVA